MELAIPHRTQILKMGLESTQERDFQKERVTTLTILWLSGIKASVAGAPNHG